MPYKCFVVMPTGAYGNFSEKDLSQRFSQFLKPAIETAYEDVYNDRGIQVIRSDKSFTNREVTDDIYEHLIYSDLVVVDISSNNANVFYEYGIRAAISPDYIVLRDKESSDKVPFDVSSVRHLSYSRDEDIDILAKKISKTLHAAKEGLLESPIEKIKKSTVNKGISKITSTLFLSKDFFESIFKAIPQNGSEPSPMALLQVLMSSQKVIADAGHSKHIESLIFGILEHQDSFNNLKSSLKNIFKPN